MLRHFLTAWLPIACAISFFPFSAGAQVKPMALKQSRYELRAGEPVPIAAPGETMDFLLKASNRKAVPLNGSGAGFVAGPNRTGDQVMLAASVRTPPGEYAVTLSATSATGEQRQTTMDVVVHPHATVPSNATRPPVVLLNGWEVGYSNSCPVSSNSSETFGNLARYLTQDGAPAVYFFDNCVEGPNETVEALAVDLATFLNGITYDNGAPVTQFDVVGFSLGGLIARAYLAGLQPNQELNPPVNTLIHKLILIAAPNFGAFVAGNYANYLTGGTQSAELIPGSALLWNLATWNQHIDDLRGVDTIAVIGNAGTYVNNVTAAQLPNASDGVVSTLSASLSFVAQNPYVTRIVPYCQVDPIAYVNSSFQPYYCNAPGIANVTTPQQYTGLIVRSFLAGNSDWKSTGFTPASDYYLTTNGGTLFAMLNGTGAYVNDITQVIWGTLPMFAGGYIGTIFYNDFVAGTGDFQATSQSLGTIDCGTVTEAIGYFAAARCKIATAIVSVGPPANTAGLVVNSGGPITITGATFGPLCNGCKVVATPAGSTSGIALSVSSWTSQSITAQLPASLSGFVTITVMATTGNDSINIMVASPSPSVPALAVSPASLQFASTNGSTPSSQSIQIANSASGTLSWTASASDSWLALSPASGTAPSTMSVAVNPVGMAPGIYNGSIQISSSGATGSPATVAVTLVVKQTQTQTTPGTITGVTNAGGFQPGFASAAWVSIFGTNLSGITYTWQSSDFVNGQLPTTLQEVSVTIDGKPAYVEYISPTQINVLAPDDANTGNVSVQVTTNQLQSNTITGQKRQFAPAFFTMGGNTAVAAQHADYSLAGTPGLITGATTTPAKPGEVVLLYGTGFGPTNPATPTGQLVTAPAALASQVQITIGGVNAPVAFAGLVEAGLYQFNVTVPTVPNGNAAVVASIGGVQSQSGVSIDVQQ